jgi:hypothetical protein
MLMSKVLTVVLITGAYLLSGCAHSRTKYHPLDESGGYSEAPVNDRVLKLGLRAMLIQVHVMRFYCHSFGQSRFAKTKGLLPQIYCGPRTFQPRKQCKEHRIIRIWRQCSTKAQLIVMEEVAMGREH